MFAFQAAVLIVIIGVTAAKYVHGAMRALCHLLISVDSINLSLYSYDIDIVYVTAPLATASITFINLVITALCYRTRMLHPLVVITFACEFLFVWLCVLAFNSVMLVLSVSVGCVGPSDYGKYWFDGRRFVDVDADGLAGSYDAGRRTTCAKNSAVLAMDVLVV